MAASLEPHVDVLFFLLVVISYGGKTRDDGDVTVLQSFLVLRLFLLKSNQSPSR